MPFGLKSVLLGGCCCLVFWAGCGDVPVPTALEVQSWTFQDTSGLWRTADVPGSIHTDLLVHNLLPNPFADQSELDVQWVENRDWTYRTVLHSPPDDGEWALEFAGLDTYAEVEVNGVGVLSANNMHRTWRIPEADLSLAGYDTLVVRLLSPIRMGQAALDGSPWPVPASNEAKPIGRQTSAVTRKAMYHYGWDWGPRLATSGIWKPVRWVRTDLELPPFRLMVESADTAMANCRVRWERPVSDITARLQKDGQDVAMQWVRIDSVTHQFTVAHPDLWWPNGMGDQPLYQLLLSGSDGQRANWRFGIRTLAWNRAPDAHGHAMQCVVNGVPVQARGANVIPPDFFPVRAETRWRMVIEDAVAAHMNMVRLWGGAHYGDERLYDLCDEWGILVWQDFMNACAMVPGDAAWRANFLAEAEQQVRRLRNRTSLAIWAGNNESEKAWRDWGWQDMYGLHGADSAAVARAYQVVFEAALPELVARLEGGEYQPSSPHHLDLEQPKASGDQHDWGVWFGKTGFEYYTDEAGRFASEFGLQSLPDRRTLQEVGVQDWTDATLQFRQRCTMDWLEPGFDGWDMMRHYAAMYFADPEAVDVANWTGGDRLAAWTYMSQLTQAEGLRQAVERHRCSQGRTSGSLYWQLDDVWPTVSWSTVDHAGRWKLAHHAVRHANQPVRIVPDRSASSWMALNAGPDPVRGTLTWAHLSLTGDTLTSGQRALDVSAFSEARLSFMPWSQEALCAWSWRNETGQIVDEGIFFPRPVSQVDWPASSVRVEPTGDGVMLKTGAPTAGVWLRAEHAGRFEDNGFLLLPHCPKRLRFLDPDGAPADPGLVRVTHFAEVQSALKPSI